MNRSCVAVINTCVSALARARQIFAEIRQERIASLTRPTAANDEAWGEWILAHFPMTHKVVQLLRLLNHFKVGPSVPSSLFIFKGLGKIHSPHNFSHGSVITFGLSGKILTNTNANLL